MNREEAAAIRSEFSRYPEKRAAMFAEFEQAMQTLIQMDQFEGDYLYLGAVYYERKMMPQAIEMYERAAQSGNVDALVNLGYIWLNGKAGMVDGQRAYSCFMQAAEQGDMQALYKLGDMYHQGVYVVKDEQQADECLDQAFVLAQMSRNLEDPIAEIYLRKARRHIKNGKYAAAMRLMEPAVRFQKQKLEQYPFRSHLLVMKQLMRQMHQLNGWNARHLQTGDLLDLFDLFDLLEAPCHVNVRVGYGEYPVSCQEVNGIRKIFFNGKEYENVMEMFEQVYVGSLEDRQRLAGCGQQAMVWYQK